MGTFPYEIVLRDIPYKKKLWAKNDDFKFQRGHMTPLKFEYSRFFRRILGHRLNGLSP
jgi:hypothetical protein